MKSSTFEPGQGTVETYLLLVHIVNNLLIKVNCNIVSTFQQNSLAHPKPFTIPLPYKKEYGNFSFKNKFCFCRRKTQKETCEAVNTRTVSGNMPCY